MLKNLLKYDLKWIFKLVGVFYALALFFAALSFVLSNIGNSTLANVLYQFSCGVTVAMVANCIINSVMRSWVRCYNNLYKDESYLTHTLPVKKSTLFLSKTLAAFICTFLSTVLSAVCIALCYYDNDFIKNSMKAVMEGLSASYDMPVFAVALLLVFIVFLEIMFLFFMGYNGIILGHKSNKGKLGKSILIGFGMYMAFNVLSVAAICVAGLFDDRIMNLIKTADAVDMSAIKVLLFAAAGIYTVYNFISYAVGVHTLKKGVNID